MEALEGAPVATTKALQEMVRAAVAESNAKAEENLKTEAAKLDAANVEREMRWKAEIDQIKGEYAEKEKLLEQIEKLEAGRGSSGARRKKGEDSDDDDNDDDDRKKKKFVKPISERKLIEKSVSMYTWTKGEAEFKEFTFGLRTLAKKDVEICLFFDLD